MIDYREHKNYFAIAYRTGTDIWTNLPMKNRGEMLIEKLSPGALVLDIGSGRGLFSKQLAELGFRVIGIDYVGEIVEKANGEIKNWGLEGRLKFMEADAMDIPFTDESFDAVCDFGLLENLYKEDWGYYSDEIIRVLKPGGYYLNISFSRETQKFFEFRPKSSESGEFQKYGVHYHFFKKDEIKNLFAHKLIPLEQDIELPDKPDQVALLETLFQKKA